MPPRIQKSQAIRNVVANRRLPGLPQDKVYNLATGRVVNKRTFLKSRDRLRKRFTERGLTYNEQAGVIMPRSDERQRIAANYLLNWVDTRGRRGQSVIGATVPYSPNWRQDILNDVVGRFEVEYNKTITRATLQEGQFIAPNLNIPAVNLPAVRMRRAKPLIIDGFSDQGWNKNKDECVIDFLRHYYKNGPDYLTTDEAFNAYFWPEWKMSGICALELENFCKSISVNMIALDIDFNVIQHYEAAYPDKQLKSLIYIVHDGHIHPIIDSNLKNSKSNQIVSSLKWGVSKKVKEKIKEKQLVNQELPVKIVDLNGQSSVNYLCREILKCGKQPKNSNIFYGDSGIKSYILNGEKVYFNSRQLEPVKEYFESIGKDYNGDTLGYYVKTAMENMNMVKSTFNPVTRSILNTKGVKNIVHRGLMHNNKHQIGYENSNLNDDEYITFDINKCHTHIMKEKVSDWLVGNYNDEVEDYEECDLIAPGLYFVETKDTYLFNKNGWYSHEIVDYGLTEELIEQSNIKKVIRMNTIEGNYLQTLFNEKYPELLEDRNTPQAKALLKCLCNTTAGMLGKTHRYEYKKLLTRNPVEAQKFILDHNNEDISFENIEIEHEGEKQNFIYAARKQYIELDKNNLPMYIQVLCHANIMMYEFMMDTTFNNLEKVVYRNCDSFTIKKHPKISTEKYKEIFHNPQEEGQLKVQPNPEKFLYMPSEDVVINWEKYNFGWIKNNDVTNSDQINDFVDYVRKHKSALVQAEAGFGKSHIIEGLDENFKTLKITGSNVSARRINGHTVHSIFGLEDGKINMKKINNLKKEEYEVIIIDEYQILRGELWNIIYQVWKELKLPVLAFGDLKQLKPVKENEHYFNNSMVKQMLGCNLICLEYHNKCRTSEELREIILPLRSEDEINITSIYENFKKIEEEKDLPLFNICFTNKHRVKYNKIINKNNYFKTENMDLKSDLPEWQGIIMHAGMPIMCLNNLYSDNFFNGERYIVIRWDEEKIYLSNDRVITFEKMLKHFVPAYMMTNHKIIGITCNEDYTIHEYNNTHLDNNWHYVVLSRGRVASQISYFE